MLPLIQKVYNKTKMLQTRRSREILSMIYCFPRFYYKHNRCQDLLIGTEKKMYYSGKKKRHTIKTHLMLNNQGIIIQKTNHEKVKRHDYDVYKKNHLVNSKRVINVVDRGYLGV